MNAIENLEQRVEERIEAVVINHTTSNIPSTHTLTHTDNIQAANSDWVVVLGILEGDSSPI